MDKFLVITTVSLSPSLSGLSFSLPLCYATVNLSPSLSLYRACSLCPTGGAEISSGSHSIDPSCLLVLSLLNPLVKLEPWRVKGRGSYLFTSLSLLAVPQGEPKGDRERDGRERRDSGAAKESLSLLFLSFVLSLRHTHSVSIDRSHTHTHTLLYASFSSPLSLSHLSLIAVLISPSSHNVRLSA